MDFYELYCEEVAINEKLRAEIKRLKAENRSLTNQLIYLQNHMDEIIERRVKEAADKLEKEMNGKLSSLQNEVLHLKSILNNDSTNSGISTSKTPINKKKRIPNSREKTDKKKGGQPGHKKSALAPFDEQEITDRVDHKVTLCPECGTPLMNEVYSYKDEYEFKIIVKKIRHYFYRGICPNCHNESKVPVPVHLKEANQYGTGIQSVILSLMNEGYVSIGRTRQLLQGFSHNEIQVSEGYISKLQKRLYNSLLEFDNELKKEIIRKRIIHWDDTVVMVATSRACLRFYGDSETAYYRAHMHKNKEGLDEDGILLALDKETVVVHDHNVVNYNDDYEFQNAECCAHLLRDLKKVVDNLKREWAVNMANLLIEGNIKRNQGEYIDAEYISLCYDTIVAQGDLENNGDSEPYYADTEATLLERLKKYKENYLLWTLNAEIPFTNNEAERGLRSSKTKMKVSGQFSNLEHAKYFATIKGYLETGHRHNMNSVELIRRALDGNPVSLEEMKKHDEEEF